MFSCNLSRNVGQDGRIETSDQDKAEILNEHFSTIGGKLANELPLFSEENRFTNITRVTPTVMKRELPHDAISEGLEKLQAKNACGQDRTAPRLLKSASDTIIPSLIYIYCILLTAVRFLPTEEVERPEHIKRHGVKRSILVNKGDHCRWDGPLLTRNER